MIGLLNFLCSDHCVLVVMHPQICSAFIMDSTMRSVKKEYTDLRDVMDEALYHFDNFGGHITRKNKKKGCGSMPCFKMNEQFPCLQQCVDTVMDAYYVIHHISEYVRVNDTLREMDVWQWGKGLEKTNAGDHRDELTRIQVKLADIINKDVVDDEFGMFYGGVDTPEEVTDRLRQQGCDTSFNTFQGVLPFLKK